MPKIKNIIKDYFNKEPKFNIINSKEIFAKGATIYGKIILENKKIPLSIGYDDGNGIMEFLLIKGTQFPYLNNFNLNIKNNDNFYFNFKIYYGDRKLVKYNKLLGEFSLENISTNRIVNVKITVKIDFEGILYFIIKENNSEKPYLTINLNSISQNEIQQLINDGESKINQSNDNIEINNVRDKLKLKQIIKY